MTASFETQIPYLPDAFPDELLGSWLSRAVRLNAQPSLVAFARSIGLRCNAKSSVADPISSAEYVRALSNYLGWDHDLFINTFTTKAYWNAFKSSEHHDASSTSLISTNPRLSQPMLRVCPECIESDGPRFGWPYFRRVHQLKTRACPEHGLLLLQECGACGKPIRSSAEPTLLHSKCTCGASLSACLVRNPAGKAWTALAKFSLGALFATPCSADLTLLRPYAIQCAQKLVGGSATSSVWELLTGTYGEEGLRWLRLRPGSEHRFGDDLTLTQPRKVSLGAPVVVALLAACDVTFERAVLAVSDLRALSPSDRPVTVGSRGPRVCFNPTNVREARAMALQFSSSGKQRYQLRLNRPNVYWMLFLKANGWLQKWLDGGRVRERHLARSSFASSIKEDRRIIAQRGKGMDRQMARSRASLRDASWLQEFDSKRPRRIDHEARIVKQLKAARAKHMKGGKARPKKWTVSAAARALKMPVKSLTAFAQRSELVRQLVPEDGDNYIARQLQWGISECIRLGVELTLTRAILTGGAKYTPESKKLASEILASRLKHEGLAR